MTRRARHLLWLRHAALLVISMVMLAPFYWVLKTALTGENISAYEVEMLVAKHPSVLEVAAVPVSSELSEDEVMIYVVCREGEKVSEEDLVRFANRNMAHFMVPRFVHFIDALPKTASEKIEKYKLKTWAEQNRASLWDREVAGLKLER